MGKKHGRVRPFPAILPTPVITATYSRTRLSSSSLAILLSLLVFIGAIVTWDKIKRRQGKEKRKRWSNTFDKCMWTISTNRKSMSAAGAQAAIPPP